MSMFPADVMPGFLNSLRMSRCQFVTGRRSARSPCRYSRDFTCCLPAVPTALHRKDRETCHLLRCKLLELHCRADSIPVSHPRIKALTPGAIRTAIRYCDSASLTTFSCASRISAVAASP